MDSAACLSLPARRPVIRHRVAPSRRSLDSEYRRRLDFEVRLAARQREAQQQGLPVRRTSLAEYPASAELVRAIAQRIALGAAVPRSGYMRYRTATVRVALSNFGRVVVSTTDGRLIGSSGFGAAWGDR